MALTCQEGTLAAPGSKSSRQSWRLGREEGWGWGRFGPPARTCSATSWTHAQPGQGHCAIVCDKKFNR